MSRKVEAIGSGSGLLTGGAAGAKLGSSIGIAVGGPVGAIAGTIPCAYCWRNNRYARWKQDRL